MDESETLAVIEADEQLAEEEFAFELPESKYWAAKSDTEELVPEIHRRVVHFEDRLRTSHWWPLISRSIAYYYNAYGGSLDIEGWSEDALKWTGEEGQLVLSYFNHYRSVISNTVNLITANPPKFQARAQNAEQRSMQQAELAEQVLEAIRREKRVDRYLRRAVEDGFVLGQGFVALKWNPHAGPERDGNPETGEITHEGDVELTNPKITDLAWDLDAKSWEEIQWIRIRVRRNKYDLAAQFPEWAPEILEAHKIDHDARTGTHDDDAPETDLIYVDEFYHVRSPALPYGRMVVSLGGRYGLSDTALPYEGLPLYRFVPSEVIDSTLGYTWAFDIQAPQEALNAVASSVCSNYAAFAVQYIFSKTGNNFNLNDLSEGLSLVECDEAPVPLQLCEIPKEALAYIGWLQAQIEQLSGVNAVSRGKPEQTYRAASALALVDSKTLQANTGAQTSYRHLIEDVGTGIAKLIKTGMTDERVFSIVGMHNRVSAKAITGKDIERVERVVVESGNPLMDTVSGKMHIAEMLMNKGLVRQPQEFITLLQSGRVEPLLRSEQAQLDLIHDEGERMMDGMPVVLSALDWHVGHIKEHQSLLNSTAIRENPEHVALIEAHVMQHLQALQMPGIQYAQIVLGFGIGPPAAGDITSGMGMGEQPGGAAPANGAPSPQKSNSEKGPGSDTPRMPEPVETPPPLGQR